MAVQSLPTPKDSGKSVGTPWRWRRRTAEAAARTALSRRTKPRRWLAGLAASAAVSTLVALGIGAQAWSASRALDEFAGCDDIGSCRRLEIEAARRLAACWVGCENERTAKRIAQLALARAEERQAVREHYRQQDQAERSERETEQLRVQAEREHAEHERALAAEREHRGQLELEQVREAAVDRRRAEERARWLGYLGLLGPDQREQRLRRCFAAKGQCDALIVDLAEAASDANEKRHLAALHERLSSGEPPFPAPSVAKRESLSPNS
jgi:hypothetical protein